MNLQNYNLRNKEGDIEIRANWMCLHHELNPTLCGDFLLAESSVLERFTFFCFHELSNVCRVLILCF